MQNVETSNIKPTAACLETAHGPHPAFVGGGLGTNPGTPESCSHAAPMRGAPEVRGDQERGRKGQVPKASDCPCKHGVVGLVLQTLRGHMHPHRFPTDPN